MVLIVEKNVLCVPYKITKDKESYQVWIFIILFYYLFCLFGIRKTKFYLLGPLNLTYRMEDISKGKYSFVFHKR